MPILVHALLFGGSAAVIWLLAGQLIDGTARIANRTNTSGFAVAFFILGFVTSISEISVATNATLEGVPQVSAGNLLGASLVIILLIIPLLAVLGGGIPMKRTLLLGNEALLLVVLLLPALLSLDGTVTVYDGIFMLVAYGLLIYKVQKITHEKHSINKHAKETAKEHLGRRQAIALDFGKILLCALVIFTAGSVLVRESIFFAALLHIPVSFVGLLVLSIGTNFPELVIALRCILGHHKDIAFGDYMGSAAANTFLYGILPLANGAFLIEASEALLLFLIFGVGLVLFFIFSRSKENLSKKEGTVLLLFYGLFLLFQILNVVRLSKSTLPPISEQTEQEFSIVDGIQKNWTGRVQTQ